MAEMLLINPRKRTRRAAAKTAKRRSRRRNPVTPLAARPAAPARRRAAVRRRNPVGLGRVRTVRRRRNPIAGFSTSGIGAQLQNAAVAGAGAVAVDLLMGQVTPFLPAALMRVPGSPSLGDAFKIAVTIAAGELLNKPTKGLSRKMAAGSLTVQAYELISNFVPSSMPVGGVGFASPARIVQGVARIGPNMSRVGAYQAAGTKTPLLSAYMKQGVSSPMLNGVGGARKREGVSAFS